MRKYLYILLALTLLTMNGCVEKSSLRDRREEEYIILSIGGVPENLIMLEDKSIEGKEILCSLFEGLVNSDEKGNIIPGIAESWSVSEDGIEYRFKIDPEALWSDGSQISAQDLVEFFSNILNPSLKNAYDYQLFSIFGAENYRTRKAKFDRVAIRAESSEELIIRMNTPCADLLHILSQPVYGLRNNMDALRDWRNKYAEIRFTGPFVISEVRKSGEILLKKNEYFRDADNVTSEKFILRPTGSEEEAFVDFEMGIVNILQTPPLSEVKRIISDENTTILVSSDIISLMFNFDKRSPGHDISFRKAVYNALEPTVIAETGLPDFTIPTEGFIYSNSTRNVFKDTAFKDIRDQSRAKKHLENMAIQKPKSIRIVGLNNDINKRIIKVIAEQIKKHLDINVQFRLYSKDELAEILEIGGYDILLGSCKKDYNSELSMLEKWTTSSKDNVVKYSNGSFDSAFLKARTEADKEKSRKSIKECEDILKQDTALIYLFNDAKVIVRSSYIRGLNVSTHGYIDLRRLYSIGSNN